MKKNYETPQIKVVTLRTDQLLAGSQIPVGGDGVPKARRNGLSDVMDDEF